MLHVLALKIYKHTVCVMFTRDFSKVCDGQDLSFPIVGRRDVVSRDVSVHCCKGDLCNHPKKWRRTTTHVPATMATGKLQNVSFEKIMATLFALILTI